MVLLVVVSVMLRLQLRRRRRLTLMLTETLGAIIVVEVLRRAGHVRFHLDLNTQLMRRGRRRRGSGVSLFPRKRFYSTRASRQEASNSLHTETTTTCVLIHPIYFSSVNLT